MKIAVLSVFLIVLFIVNSYSTYVWWKKEVYWEDAKNYCEALGMRLLVLETKSDVDKFRVFIKNEHPELWLGLNWNSTVDNYEWSTGEQLPVVNWCNAPDYRSSNQACVTWKDDKCMESITCSSTRKYFCFNTNNDLGYMAINENVDYYTAKNKCEENGGHLPMIRTMEEREDFIQFSKLHWEDKVWLGGEEMAEDDIRWLSGEEFPVHSWHGSKVWDELTKYPEVHVHVESNSLEFHPDNDRKLEVVCESVDEPKTSGYFVYVADDVKTWAIPLAELHVTKRMQCAFECSKVVRCKKYTLKFPLCTLYKDVLFYSSDSGTGSSLWLKVFKDVNVNYF